MRRVGLALFGLAFLSGCGGCATRGSVEYRPARFSLPPAFFNMVSVRTGVGMGWGSPLPSGVILTVNHLVPGGEKAAVWSDGRGRTGNARLVWSSDAMDIAAYQPMGDTSLPALQLNRSEPELGEILCYRNYIPREIPSFGCGPYLGKDVDGEGHIDGWASGGVSGSGVIDEAGQLRGVVYAGANWAGGVRGGEVDEVLRSLDRKTHFRSTVIFVLAKNLPEGY